MRVGECLGDFVLIEITAAANRLYGAKTRNVASDEGSFKKRLPTVFGHPSLHRSRDQPTLLDKLEYGSSTQNAVGL